MLKEAGVIQIRFSHVPLKDKSAHADKENKMKNIQQYLFMSFQTGVFRKSMVCRGRYNGYVKHKRNNPPCVPWDSQRNGKMQFLFLLLLALTFLSEMKILFPRNAKQKTI